MTDHLIPADTYRMLVEESLLGVYMIQDERMLYEMWLIGPDGVPIDVGTFSPTPGNEFVVVELEQPFEGFDVFAVTLEQTRVDAPSSDPVLTASI